MTKSQFNIDIQNEQVVNGLINKKLLESEIVNEIIKTTPQENRAGVDLKLKSKKIFGDDNEHNVDYKSAINNRKTINDKNQSIPLHSNYSIQEKVPMTKANGKLEMDGSSEINII